MCHFVSTAIRSLSLHYKLVHKVNFIPFVDSQSDLKSQIELQKAYSNGIVPVYQPSGVLVDKEAYTDEQLRVFLEFSSRKSKKEIEYWQANEVQRPQGAEGRSDGDVGGSGEPAPPLSVLASNSSANTIPGAITTVEDVPISSFSDVPGSEPTVTQILAEDALNDTSGSCLEDAMDYLDSFPTASSQISAFEEAVKRLLAPMSEKLDKLVERSEVQSEEPSLKRRRVLEAPVHKPSIQIYNNDVIFPKGTSLREIVSTPGLFRLFMCMASNLPDYRVSTNANRSSYVVDSVRADPSMPVSEIISWSFHGVSYI